MNPQDRIVTLELKGKVFIPCKHTHIIREILEENYIKEKSNWGYTIANVEEEKK